MEGYTMTPKPYIPTPEQIAKECEAIQKTWTTNERRKRVVCPSPPVMPHTSDDLNTLLAEGSRKFNGLFTIASGGGDFLYHGHRGG